MFSENHIFMSCMLFMCIAQHIEWNNVDLCKHVVYVRIVHNRININRNINRTSRQKSIFRDFDVAKKYAIE